MARVEPRRAGAPARRVTIVPAWGTARPQHAHRRVVLEQDNGVVAGAEVKSAATVVTAEFRGVRKLREAASPHWAAGVVLYDGETTSSFGNGLFAVPTCALWES
jgi:hypothetical protein